MNSLLHKILGTDKPSEPSNLGVIKAKEQIIIEKPEQLNFFDEKILTREAKQEYRIVGQVFDTYWIIEYRDKMLEIGDKYDIPVIDLGKATADYLNTVGDEGSKKLFMWLEKGAYEGYPDGKQDNAHLQQAGAKAFAGLLAGLIRSYDRDDKLDKVKAELA